MLPIASISPYLDNMICEIQKTGASINDITKMGKIIVDMEEMFLIARLLTLLFVKLYSAMDFFKLIKVSTETNE